MDLINQVCYSLNIDIQYVNASYIRFLSCVSMWALTLLLTLQKGLSAMPCSSMRICLILRGSSERMSCCSSCPMLTLDEAEAQCRKRDASKRLGGLHFNQQITHVRWTPYLECHRRKAEAWRWGWWWLISSSAAPPAPSCPPPSAAPQRAYERRPPSAEAAPAGSHTESCRTTEASLKRGFKDVKRCTAICIPASCRFWLYVHQRIVTLGDPTLLILTSGKWPCSSWMTRTDGLFPVKVCTPAGRRILHSNVQKPFFF